MAEQWLQAGRRIAERFELTAPYADSTLFSRSLDTYGVQVWKATDSVLARELRAIIIPSDHPYRARAVDAARKAGLFEDPQVTAVLNVCDTLHSEDSTDHDASLRSSDNSDSSDNVTDASAIFTEFPIGTPLSSYLSDEPLPEPLVTAIIGEAATVINHARRRGLRHLQLSAQHFYLSDSGEFLLDGVAILAALAGVDTDRMSEDIDRDEARGLLVLYAALLEGKDFPADPAEHQGYIERAAARSDLPQRIQNLFLAELTEESPTSAADILRRIVPWGDISMDLFPSYAQTAITTDHSADTDSDVDEDSGSAPNDDKEILEVDDDSFADYTFGVFDEVDDVNSADGEDAGDEESAGDEADLEREEDDESYSANMSEQPSQPSKQSTQPSSSMFYAQPLIESKGTSLTVSSIVMIVFALLVLLALIIGASQLFSPLDPVTVTPHQDPVPAQSDESGGSISEEAEENSDNQTPELNEIGDGSKAN